MIAMIEQLIAAGHAYARGRPCAVRRVGSMPDYGKLSRRSLDEMIAGARVEVAPYKRDPMDFVLWKPSTPRRPGLGQPVGPRPPGLAYRVLGHAAKHLGETFDIHGGGIDLDLPAPRERDRPDPTALTVASRWRKVWMHNGFLQVEGEKMSKILGNFFTIRDLLKDWPGEVLRFNMLQHPLSPADGLDRAGAEGKLQRILERWYERGRGRRRGAGDAADDVARGAWRRSQHARKRSRLHCTSRPPGSHATLAGAACWRLAGLLGRRAEVPHRGCQTAPTIDRGTRSSARSPPATKRARRRTSPRPTAFATSCSPRASCSKDGPTGTTWEVKR